MIVQLNAIGPMSGPKAVLDAYCANRVTVPQLPAGGLRIKSIAFESRLHQSAPAGFAPAGI